MEKVLENFIERKCCFDNLVLNSIYLRKTYNIQEFRCQACGGVYYLDVEKGEEIMEPLFYNLRRSLEH